MPQADDSQVVVIGAGPAGLAVSACLRREGVAHLVLEREATPAASWRRHYDRLHLHTTKQQSALPMTPWPRAAPRYPSRDEVLAYLEAYAREHQVEPRCGVEVTRLAPAADAFALQTSAGPLAPRIVVVATGRNRVPHRPVLDGLPGFGGEVLHASEYRRASPFRGRRVLVVGCGNSGAEIALDLAEQGVAVAMVVRGPVHVVPRDLFGRPAQHTSILLSHLPIAWRDAISTCVIGLAQGDLSPLGLPRPSEGPASWMARTGRIPMLDLGTVAMIRRGRIAVRPAVARVEADAVAFVDGRREPFDAIVLATGYSDGLARWMPGWDAASPWPGLHRVGFRTVATGALREIAREAVAVAREIRRARA